MNFFYPFTLFCLVILPPVVADTTVTVNADQVVREHDRTHLLGTNAGLWYQEAYINHPTFQQHFKAWSPSKIRMPGGTWSNEFYWNGNGVRNGKNFDASQLKNHYWQVDFSAYAPGFRVHDVNGHLADFHGNIDIRQLHQFVQDAGAEAVVSVNAGTGTPEMAAEWVKFAQKNQFKVSHWEVGNELDGDWEVGHYLPDGTRMTGELYAKRFLEFAQAMKAVDPNIKVGGPVSSSEALILGEDLVRIAGDQMDFFSFHSYPVEKKVDSLSDALEATKGVIQTVATIRGWFKKYHPERADQVEIGLTEWNQKVAEDQDTAEIGNGLWCAAYIGRMMEAGIDFANQWDLFSVTEEGAHGAFLKNKEMAPTATYWAMYLWKHHMQDQMLKVDAGSGSGVTAFATKSNDRVSVMLINPDELHEKTVALNLSGAATSQARLVQFTSAQYVWDPYQQQPAWSVAPAIRSLSGDEMKQITVPPMSIYVVEYQTGDQAFEKAPPAQRGAPQLEIALPATHPADLPLEGVVLIRDAETGSGAAGVGNEAVISVSGPAEIVKPSVRVSEGAGKFVLNFTGTGEVVVKVQVGDYTAERTVNVEPVLERPEIHWTFDGEPDSWGLSSTFPLVASEQAMPNQKVAEIQLNDVIPAKEKDILLHAEPLPKKLDRKRIGGVTFRIKKTPELKSDDPKAAVVVILQSDANHWMPIARIPLSQLSADWEVRNIKLEKPEDILVMPQAYALRLQLSSTKAVGGTIYLDDLGFILRGEGK